MPKQLMNEHVECEFFRWILYLRSNRYYADGRAKSLNGVNLGRHSLGVASHAEAIRLVHLLDKKIAKHRGHHVPDVGNQCKRLTLVEGAAKYMASLDKPHVMCGVSKSTLKRYRSVFSKFTPFAIKQGISHWDEVRESHVTAYAEWLESDRKYSTQYFELILLKQTVNWLITQGLMPESARITLRLRKPNRSVRHCYTKDQVKAILAFCEAPVLRWLHWLLQGLIYLGLRIEELAAIKWHHIEFSDEAKSVIRLDDQSQVLLSDERSDRPLVTKSRRSRELPIHKNLLAQLKERMTDSTSSFVFTSKHGKPLNSGWARMKLVEVLQAVANQHPNESWDKDFAKARFHSFRNYFVTVCADAGVPIPMLMCWLGHQHSSMIDRYYRPRDDVAQV